MKKKLCNCIDTEVEHECGWRLNQHGKKMVKPEHQRLESQLFYCRQLVWQLLFWSPGNACVCAYRNCHTAWLACVVHLPLGVCSLYLKAERHESLEPHIPSLIQKFACSSVSAFVQDTEKNNISWPKKAFFIYTMFELTNSCKCSLMLLPSSKKIIFTVNKWQRRSPSILPRNGKLLNTKC